MRTINKSVLVMLLCVMLAGCGNKASKTDIVETSEVEVLAQETEEYTEPESMAEETTVEETSTEEIVEEIYIPEGIDMNSTLPGKQWLESFVGNVEEAVVVVFSDETGRKEVVQANSEVTFNPDKDKFGIYLPEHIMGPMGCTTHAISVTESDIFSSECEILEVDAEKMRSIPERPGKVTFRNSEEEWFIEFTILVE